MTWKRFVIASVCLALMLIAHPSRATHPLITDDTGTQGKGKFQLEVNGQYDWDKKNVEGVSIKSTGSEISATLSCGILETVDLVLSLPYLTGKVKENDVKVYDEHGIGDTVLEAKWRLYEKESLSLALKPGVIIPTGNDDKGLGGGRLGGHLFLIASREAGPWAFHANLGYIRNENHADERKDIWHASLAATWEIIKNLKLAGNAGIERSPDNHSNNLPAFLIGGIIYSILENFDIDFGIKYGLTKSENDCSLMSGLTYRF